VKAFIEKSRTNNAMVNPFACQFRLAGVESAVMDGTDLSNDGFKQEVDEAIRKTVEDKRVVLKCSGYFNNHVVPVCDAYDRDGISLSESLVKQGWVLPNSALGIVTDKQQERMDAALEQAKQDQVGAWKPFHNMFRGLN
jgi:endonuclease YncB( thermonuclease family)